MEDKDSKFKNIEKCEMDILAEFIEQVLEENGFTKEDVHRIIQKHRKK